jgi:16S rRNA U1498 N3-methylase RsmE
MDGPYDSNKNFKYLYEKNSARNQDKEKLDYFNQEEHQYKKQRKKLHHNNNIYKIVHQRRMERLSRVFVSVSILIFKKLK